MQFMVLCHHGLYYYNIKLEVLLVPAWCLFRSFWKREGNGLDRMQGSHNASSSSKLTVIPDHGSGL